MQENPLKAEVRSADDEQRINVVVKQSTTFKRTLLQVTGGRLAGWVGWVLLLVVLLSERCLARAGNLARGWNAFPPCMHSAPAYSIQVPA